MRAEEQLKETMSREHLSEDAKKRILAAVSQVPEPAAAAPKKPFFLRPAFLRVSSFAAACAVILLIVLVVKNAGGIQETDSANYELDDAPRAEAEPSELNHQSIKDESPDITAAALTPGGVKADPEEKGIYNNIDGVKDATNDFPSYTIADPGDTAALVPTKPEADPKPKFVCVFPTDYEEQRDRFQLIAVPLIQNLYVEESVYFIIKSVTEEDGVITASGVRRKWIGYTIGTTDEPTPSDADFAYEETVFLRRFRKNPDTGEYEVIKD